jgi:hypothetical protein
MGEGGWAPAFAGATGVWIAEVSFVGFHFPSALAITARLPTALAASKLATG